MSFYPEGFLDKIVNVHFPDEHTFNLFGAFRVSPLVDAHGANPNIICGSITCSASGITLPESLLQDSSGPGGTPHIYPAHNSTVTMEGTTDPRYTAANVFFDGIVLHDTDLPYLVTCTMSFTSVPGVITPTIALNFTVNGGSTAAVTKHVLITSGPFGPPVAGSVTGTVLLNKDGSYTVTAS